MRPLENSKGSPYSIAELIPVLGSQPAGDVSHKPGGRMPVGWSGRRRGVVVSGVRR